MDNDVKNNNLEDFFSNGPFTSLKTIQDQHTIEKVSSTITQNSSLNINKNVIDSINLSEIEITEDYKKVIDLINKDSNPVFISGRAGTGKTTLIYYLMNTLKHKMMVVAPTGVAAINIGGSTIHKTFGLPPRLITKEDITGLSSVKNYLLRNLQILIIDEVSMVRADVLDGIDWSLQLNRGNKLPFGGVKVLMIGDLFQLPPVVNSKELDAFEQLGYEGQYFFNSFSLRNSKMDYIELQKVYRQKDDEFIDLLSDVRLSKNIVQTIRKINDSCYDKEIENAVTNLTTTNARAEEINNIELENLEGVEKTYLGLIEGKFDAKEDRLPVPLMLRLKIGAQVMFVKNDYYGRWVNGTIGFVTEMNDNYVMVRKASDNNIYTVEFDKWQTYEYAFDAMQNKIIKQVSGSYVQIPLIHAWAITIHKSQGKTIDAINIDLGRGAFAPGQVYVALSRCRTLENISLSRKISVNDIMTNNKIRTFYKKISEIGD